VWSDYICPWAYLGRDRTELLRSLGVEVMALPYELHPEIPPQGRAIRPDGRTARVYAAIAEECAEAGMAFRPPSHVPNSRRALATAEVVRAQAPACFEAVDEALFAAHFVEGRDIGDPDVVDTIVRDAGLAATEVRTLVDKGQGHDAVNASMVRASEKGVAATPAWLFGADGQGLVLPGVQPRELYERIVTRLRARAGNPPPGSER
jgi:predicted DsbA family dithiol-disulfide isomerase